MHDQIDQGQYRRLSHEPLDMHIVGQFAERGRLTFGADGDQDVDVQRCYLTDRWLSTSTAPKETVPRVRYTPGRVRAAPSQPGKSALDSL